MRKAIFKSIDHEGITAEDIAKSLNQIQRYESQAKVHLLKQAARITKIKYPKSLKNRLRGLI